MDRIPELSQPIPATPAEPTFISQLASAAQASVGSTPGPVPWSSRPWFATFAAAAAVVVLAAGALILSGTGRDDARDPTPPATVTTPQPTAPQKSDRPLNGGDPWSQESEPALPDDRRTSSQRVQDDPLRPGVDDTPAVEHESHDSPQPNGHDDGGTDEPDEPDETDDETDDETLDQPSNDSGEPTDETGDDAPAHDAVAGD